MADCNNPCSGIVITSADIDTLQYIQGVNVTNCVKFESPASLVCRMLGGMLANGEAVPATTQLVGADCRTYTIPVSSQTALTVNDSATIDLSVSGSFGHTLTAEVKISTQLGNQIVVNSDGIFVDTTVTDICPILAGLPALVTGTVPTNAKIPFFDPNSFACYTGTLVPLCTQLQGIDTALDSLVPNLADVLYVRADGTCGRAPLPIGFSASECSIGAVITSTLPPANLVGLTVSGCLTRVPNCQIFSDNFIGSVAPSAMGSFGLLGRDNGSFCARIVPAFWHASDGGINPIAEMAIGLPDPIGTLTFTADPLGGLALQVVPDAPNGAAEAHFAVDVSNGWDTLLVDTSSGSVVRTVGIDNTGNLVKFNPASTNCTIGIQVAGATPQTMPGYVTTLDALNCLVKLNIGARGILFGNANGDHRLAEDLTGFVYDPTSKEMHLGVGILVAYTNANCLVVGNNLSAQNNFHSAIFGSGNTITGTTASGIFGTGHVVATTTSNNFLTGNGHSIGNGSNNNIGGGSGNALTGSFGLAIGVGLEARYSQSVFGRYNTLQGQLALADGNDNALMIGTGSSNGARDLGFAVRYDNCWLHNPQKAFGAQVAVGAQPDDATAITQLGIAIGTGAGLRGTHAMVLVGGLAHVFFFNGTAWVRAY